MRFLVDASLSPMVVQELRAAGHNAVRETINRDDVCETMPNPTGGRIGKRLYGRGGAREFHIILVVNPGDTLQTVTTVYEADRKDFPDGRLHGGSGAPHRRGGPRPAGFGVRRAWTVTSRGGCSRELVRSAGPAETGLRG
jgi:hypothetical protein